MKTRMQALRFCIAGGVGVSLYGIFFFGLPEVGVDYLTAAPIAYLINVISNFCFNRYWTFGKDRVRKGLWREMAGYFGMTVVFLPANSGILWVLVERAEWEKLYAQLVATTVLTIISFFLSRKIFAN